MSPSTTYARIFLFVILVNAFGMAVAPTLNPPWQWWRTWIIVLADSQLALLVIVAALAAAPWYIRWPCVFPIVYLLSRSWRTVPDVSGSWQDGVALWNIPHALTALMLFFLLRELGFRIAVDDVALPPPGNWRRFTLRRLFAWTAAAAALSLAWKRIIQLQHDVAHFGTFSHWQILLMNVGLAVPQTMLDWMAIQLVLGRPRLIVRLAWLLLFAAAALVQAVASELHRESVGGIIVSWWHDLLPICLYDLLYLAPVAAVLLLARAAGYRLVRSAARDE